MTDLFTYFSVSIADLLIYFNVSMVVLALGATSYFMFLQKKSKKPVPTVNDRRDEVGELSAEEKVIYEQAEELATKGHVVSAAKIMESLRVYRRSVELLEEHGQIKEATNILLRLHAPNRAAAIYENHGYWLEAIDCHKIDLNYTKAAEIYENQVEDLSSAAHHYELAEDLVSAARCHEQSGNIRAALKCHTEGGSWNKAVDLAGQLFTHITPEGFNPEKSELQVFEKAIRKKNIVDPNFLEILSRENRLHPLVYADIGTSNLERAKKCIPYLSANASATLIGMCVKKGVGERLAKTFAALNELDKAGDTLESLGLREEAKEFYEAHSMHTRAFNMYEPDDPKAKEAMDSLIAQLDQKAHKNPQSKESNSPKPVDFVAYRLRRAFNSSNVVKMLTMSEKDSLWSMGSVATFKKGETIVSKEKHQEQEQKLFVILEGSAEASSHLPKIGGPIAGPAVVDNANLIESANAIAGHPYNCDYIAKEDSEVWDLDSKALNRCFAQHPNLKRKMLSASLDASSPSARAI